MADTAALTRAYRIEQGRIAAAVAGIAGRAYADLTDLGDLDGSFPRFIASIYPVIRQGHQRAAVIGADYYEAHRLQSGVTGDDIRIELAQAPGLRQVTASALSTGPIAVKIGLRDGRTPAEALTIAESRLSGAMFRLTADGARDTVFDNARRDPRAPRWQRVSDGDPCDFCEMLVGRGAVYFSEGTADSGGYHDKCNCSVEPVYT